MKHLFFIFCIFTLNLSFAQKTNRTLSDAEFKTGDLIKIPQIDFFTCCWTCANDGVPQHTKDSLKLIAGFIQKHPELTFQIDEHTDQRGDATKTKKFSQDRANSIRQYLVDKLSVNGTQVSAKGFGGTVPLRTDAEIKNTQNIQEREALYAQNRRTVLRVVGKK